METNITLNSPTLEVEEVLKKTKAEVFGNLKKNSLIHLSVPVEGVGIGSGGGTRAVYITVKNVETGEETRKSFNEIGRYLRCFKLEPLKRLA